MNFNKLIKDSFFTQRAIASGVSIPESTINKWNKSTPATSKALSVLKFVGYEGVPDNGLEYLLERYNKLSKTQKGEVFKRSGISIRTLDGWKKGVDPSFSLYLIFMQTIDNVLGEECTLAHIYKRFY